VRIMCREIQDHPQQKPLPAASAEHLCRMRRYGGPLDVLLPRGWCVAGPWRGHPV